MFKNLSTADYSLKSLWGIPKQLQKAITSLTKHNNNKDP